MLNSSHSRAVDIIKHLQSKQQSIRKLGGKGNDSLKLYVLKPVSFVWIKLLQAVS